MSIRTERCPKCKGSGLIKVDDWIIKGKTDEELAKEKKEALADIVEVVRCKDCKHSIPSRCGLTRGRFLLCRITDNYNDQDFYCAKGERIKADEKR